MYSRRPRLCFPGQHFADEGEAQKLLLLETSVASWASVVRSLGLRSFILDRVLFIVSLFFLYVNISVWGLWLGLWNKIYNKRDVFTTKALFTFLSTPVCVCPRLMWAYPRFPMFFQVTEEFLSVLVLSLVTLSLSLSGSRCLVLSLTSGASRPADLRRNPHPGESGCAAERRGAWQHQKFLQVQSHLEVQIRPTLSQRHQRQGEWVQGTGEKIWIIDTWSTRSRNLRSTFIKRG